MICIYSNSQPGYKDGLLDKSGSAEIESISAGWYVRYAAGIDEFFVSDLAHKSKLFWARDDKRVNWFDEPELEVELAVELELHPPIPLLLPPFLMVPLPLLLLQLLLLPFIKCNFKCRLRLPDCEKFNGQWSHWYGFSPLCILQCLVNVDESLNVRLHILHL